MANITRETYHAGMQIFREGEPGNCAYIIESGSVTVTTFKNGRSFEIGNLQSGELFGEMALVDDHMRSATVTANEPTEVIRIPRDYIKDRLTKSDHVTNLFLKVILKKFRATQYRLLERGGAGQDQVPPMGQTTAYEQSKAIGELRFEHELQESLEKHELHLLFQPIVSLSDNKIAGFESLVRWNHPQRGPLQPQDFLSAAEDSGLVIALGREVLRLSCEALQKMQPCSETPLYICVNASPQELGHNEFTPNFIRTLNECNIKPETVKLEITEHAWMDDPEGTAIALDELTASGVRLAIDDFGTGFSSFTYLCRFPIDTLKIDRSFVVNMQDSDRTMNMVRALITLAQSLGMDVIAEGIETEQQLRVLRELGCHNGQGYYFANPLDLNTALSFLQAPRNSQAGTKN